MLKVRTGFMQNFKKLNMKSALNYLFSKQFVQINRNNERYIRYFLFIATNTYVRLSQNIPCLNQLAANVVTNIAFMGNLIKF